MILTKEVEVHPTGKMIQYYVDKGYDAKWRVPMLVDIEDLSEDSHVDIEVLCDYCGKEVSNISYRRYCSTIKKFGKYACSECSSIHKKIGCIQKYGCENPTQNPEIRAKQVETLVRHYGVDSPLRSEEILQRAIQTFRCRFGVDNPLYSDEIKEKSAKSFYKYSSQKCSKQQLYLFNLYNTDNNANLNFPVSCYNADICFTENKLVCEYDGGGHNLPIKLGSMTQEEFQRREIIRHRIFKDAGYQTMTIVSERDLLPSDEILIKMLMHTKQYFSDYQEHSWIEYNIDTSTVRNAERKDGVFFDYGDLRKIK